MGCHLRMVARLGRNCARGLAAMGVAARMTAQTVAQRQADLRARRAMLGLAEVRGIYLPKEQHKKLRAMAKKLRVEPPPVTIRKD